MASSRVFVKGLPPTLTEGDFRKHFGQQGTITDARLFQNRRIGYIGYDSPEVALKAVKYFNRTFMKMSKIAVEIATPIKPKQSFSADPATNSFSHVKGDEKTTATKRKRALQDDHGTRDPELVKFLETMRPAKDQRLVPSQTTVEAADQDTTPAPVTIDEPIKRRRVDDAVTEPKQQDKTDSPPVEPMIVPAAEQPPANTEEQTSNEPRSDADWLRSRTSRLLGLDDEDDLDEDDRGQSIKDGNKKPTITQDSDDESGGPQPAVEETAQASDALVPAPDDAPHMDETESKIRDTQRLYLRNLAYDVTEQDLHAAFAQFGNIIEVHLPIDGKTGAIKGFAYVLYNDADCAVQAWRTMDGTTFHGRLVHILPATAKRETTQLDDFALSKLPLKKQQQIKRRREAATTQYNWNALYMNADAVLSSVADRFGLKKGEMLDPTSSDAAVKQAHAETHIIQETKSYFKKAGVDLDSFKSSSRGDTAILIKNIPYDIKSTDLREMFETHGKLKAFLMPPSGVIAIAAYEQPAHAKAAFGALAYRKIQNSVLFLEKAPKRLFVDSGAKTVIDDGQAHRGDEKTHVNASDLMAQHSAATSATSSTLFVRNLNFTTTTERLIEIFKPLDGFLTARVKTKTDPKKPGQVLSMGFGFLEFRSIPQANAALAAMDDYKLDDHRLQIRFSQKGVDPAEQRRKDDQAKRKDSASTKIVIKNLPFEATKKDIRSLFGAYGQLRSVRMPMKMDRSIRGFAFADFTTPKEAVNALEALKDTHLLGRRLVLDFAAPEAEDAEAEIEKMQKKVGSQMNKVALQKLTSGGRKKFSVEDPAGADDDMES